MTGPPSPDALERIWSTIPFGLVVAWTLTGQYPSLADQLASLEAERAGES